ncbi:homocysteine S-methyltransferase family protein [Oscillospiraceae bacterium PP1C4]
MNELDRLRLPLLLDGATGTEYMKAGMPSGVCVEQWASEHAEVVRSVVTGYADAGSNIVYAPTFLANAGNLKMYGLEDQVSVLNSKLVGIVKDALHDRDVLVAGDLSTTGLMCEPFGDTEFVRLISIYAEQAAALAKAGVDLLVIETMSSLAECRAAAIAARQTGLPVMLTMTVNSEGRTMWGDDVLACLIVLQDMGLYAFGLNCSEGPDDMVPLFERIAPYAKIPLIAKPNAGNPLLTPIQFSDKCARLLRRGVSIIGGCCGTNPEYISALRHMLDSFDIDRVKIQPEEYEILAAARSTYYLDNDLEYSDPITCEVDMADVLLDISHESYDAVLIHLDTPDDGYRFSLNAHMIDMPVAFESESPEALENALLHYNGKALVVSTSSALEKELLEEIAARYGAIVL